MFITKEFDVCYEECNEDIADALRSGKAIKCICKTTGGQYIVFISQYSDLYGYYSSDTDMWFSTATPIRSKKILKDAVSIMKILVSDGWKYDDYNAAWYKLTADRPSMVGIDWNDCGKEDVKGYPDNFYTYQED